MENTSTRTPEEIYGSHGKALVAEDLDRLAANFAEDAVQISPAGVRRGREGIREGFIQLFKDLPQANWEMRTTLFGGDVLLLEWSATSGTNRAEHGVDTFVFRDGLIQAQTVHYALTPNDKQPYGMSETRPLGHPLLIGEGVRSGPTARVPGDEA